MSRKIFKFVNVQNMFKIETRHNNELFLLTLDDIPYNVNAYDIINGSSEYIDNLQRISSHTNLVLPIAFVIFEKIDDDSWYIHECHKRNGKIYYDTEPYLVYLNRHESEDDLFQASSDAICEYDYYEDYE